jgi:hypothetical protein
LSHTPPTPPQHQPHQHQRSPTSTSTTNNRDQASDAHPPHQPTHHTDRHQSEPIGTNRHRPAQQINRHSGSSHATKNQHTPAQSTRACHKTNKQPPPPKHRQRELQDARVHYPDLKQQPHTWPDTHRVPATRPGSRVLLKPQPTSPHPTQKGEEDPRPDSSEPQQRARRPPPPAPGPQDRAPTRAPWFVSTSLRHHPRRHTFGTRQRVCAP